jgi:hypothetical protein
MPDRISRLRLLHFQTRESLQIYRVYVRNRPGTTTPSCSEGQWPRGRGNPPICQEWVGCGSFFAARRTSGQLEIANDPHFKSGCCWQVEEAEVDLSGYREPDKESPDGSKVWGNEGTASAADFRTDI